MNIFDLFARLVNPVEAVEAKYASRGWFIQTFTSQQYYPTDPRAEDVDIRDIAHSLARLCRYTGHVACDHYSVAEHSWHVSYLVAPEHAFAGLMHDAPEYVVGDVSAPLKRSLPDFRAIEQRNWLAIAEAFGLPEKLPAEVHTADRQMLGIEQAALMPAAPYHFPATAGVKLFCWRPEIAERMFLERFHELTAQRPQHPATPAERSAPTWYLGAMAGHPA